MSIPDFQTIMLPVLQICDSGVIQINDITKRISDEFEMTDEEREELVPSGVMPKIKNRTSWATTYLATAKLLERPKRGFYTTTERGKKS